MFTNERTERYVSLVLDGQKPGALIGLHKTSELDAMSELGLEAIYASNLQYQFNFLAIGRRALAGSVIGDQDAIAHSIIDPTQMQTLRRAIATKSIAEAIVYLDCYPRHNEDSMEDPEVAVLLGRIFGYKACDIDYYLTTRYSGEVDHPASKKLLTGRHDESIWADRHILCGDCAVEMLDQFGHSLPESATA